MAFASRVTYFNQSECFISSFRLFKAKYPCKIVRNHGETIGVLDLKLRRPRVRFRPVWPNWKIICSIFRTSDLLVLEATALPMEPYTTAQNLKVQHFVSAAYKWIRILKPNLTKVRFSNLKVQKAGNTHFNKIKILIFKNL